MAWKFCFKVFVLDPGVKILLLKQLLLNVN